MAKRLAGRYGYPAEKPFAVTLHPDRLEEPLRWKKPRKVFVVSMGDLFHEAVPDEFIAQVFAVMALAKHHTFQVLTKRPERMQRLLSSEGFAGDVWGARDRLLDRGGFPRELAKELTYWDQYDERDAGVPERTMFGYEPGPTLPLPNVWLGVSVENQQAADERIPLLLQTPAAVRFISAEPLLGPVDLSHLRIGALSAHPQSAGAFGFNALTGERLGLWVGRQKDACLPRLDWVIVGGESGPGARPMHPDWARSLRNQCKAAGVAFMFKQHGEWAVASHENGYFDSDMARNNAYWVDMRGQTHKPSNLGLDNPIAMFRAGKKAAGRLLDGRVWDQYPEAQS